ncbi:hypothetical protein N8L13_09210 [Pseudocitrobacter sp. MW920760]|nr:hypothetical protein [Pseudocitrobacter sp. MW920760]
MALAAFLPHWVHPQRQVVLEDRHHLVAIYQQRAVMAVQPRQLEREVQELGER